MQQQKRTKMLFSLLNDSILDCSQLLCLKSEAHYNRRNLKYYSLTFCRKLFFLYLYFTCWYEGRTLQLLKYITSINFIKKKKLTCASFATREPRVNTAFQQNLIPLCFHRIYELRKTRQNCKGGS